MFTKLVPLVLSFALAGGVAAQAPTADAPVPAPAGMDPGRAQLTRAQLEALLQRYQATAGSTAYTAAYRSRTRAQTTLIRDRLENGDLQVGDHIKLTVEGQQPLTSDFTVEPGRVITLPAIGAIPLAGVLRSELETDLTKQLSKYIVQPTVHAESMVRITVLGAVGKPGFYLVPADALLPDALTQAGGPVTGADLNKMKITRDGQTIWDGGTLRTALVDGWTIDQLSLRAGDQIEVPAAKSANLGNAARVLLYSIGPLVFLLRSLHII